MSKQPHPCVADLPKAPRNQFGAVYGSAVKVITPAASEYEGSIRFSLKEVKKIKRVLKQSLQQAEAADTAASGVHAETLKKALKLISSKWAVTRPGGDSQ